MDRQTAQQTDREKTEGAYNIYRDKPCGLHTKTVGSGGSDLDEQGDLEEARGQPAEDEGADDEQGGEQSLAVPDVVHGVAGPVSVRPPHLHVDPPVRVGDDEEGDEGDGEDEVLALVVGVLHELAVVEVARHLAELGHVGEEDGAAADEGDEPDGADEELSLIHI